MRVNLLSAYRRCTMVWCAHYETSPIEKSTAAASPAAGRDGRLARNWLMMNSAASVSSQPAPVAAASTIRLNICKWRCFFEISPKVIMCFTCIACTLQHKSINDALFADDLITIAAFYYCIPPTTALFTE
ncbi:hypothetical protein PRIPAC_87280 [Pristionchus pacificus]|uniref:Uncharacterized protein n=1 Tax=Pristionchus pacificus TaxID=54126 RepID=A0A2A6B3N9_PRIPA|nr:hypothetical protein PRIPAC_87280 [Pristionchus pacificus]|eukprot:PDM60478.1 hypothetical protein PRIPAC_53456 [Pristionchus pacificus]